MYDCISIGDCVFDVNLFIHEAAVEGGKLCLNNGEKIAVDQIHRGLGGNAANNAVGLKRLGFNVGLFTIYGDDQIGERIGQYLEAEKIDKNLIQIESGTQSRYSTIINFAGERTILEYCVNRKYVLPTDLEETGWIYLSSVGPEYEVFFKEVGDYVAGKSIKMVFNPANAQLEKPYDTYRRVIESTFLLVLNKEEAEKMLGTTADDFKKLLFGLRDLGPKVVAITDGKNGSYAYDGDKYWQIGAFDLPVKQRTGAGDAYAAGFMAALIKKLTVSEAMVWGAIDAAAVVSREGTQTGLLTSAEMQVLLEKDPSFQAKEI